MANLPTADTILLSTILPLAALLHDQITRTADAYGIRLNRRRRFPRLSSRGRQRPARAKNAPHRGRSNLTGKTVYLVDSHSLIYQVFHALPEMSGPNGQPVAAVQGFVRDCLDLIEVRKADYLICAFDHGEKTFRNEIYEEYKAHRDEMPADLQLQIPVIKRFLAALGILTLGIDGFEADDILATVAGRSMRRAAAACRH